MFRSWCCDLDRSVCRLDHGLDCRGWCLLGDHVALFLLGGQLVLGFLLLLLPLMKHRQLLDGDNTQQMTWRCIGGVHQADFDRVGSPWCHAKVRQGQAFASAQPNVDFLHHIAVLNSDRASKRCERLFPRDNRVAHHQLMDSLAFQIQGDVVTDSVGSDVVQG